MKRKQDNEQSKPDCDTPEAKRRKTQTNFKLNYDDESVDRDYFESYSNIGLILFFLFVFFKSCLVWA